MLSVASTSLQPIASNTIDNSPIQSSSKSILKSKQVATGPNIAPAKKGRPTMAAEEKAESKRHREAKKLTINYYSMLFIIP